MRVVVCGASLVFVSLVVVLGQTAQDLPNAPSTQQEKLKTISEDRGWPRTVNDAGKQIVIYQPQVEKWDGNRIYLYAALELKRGKEPSNYGVVWFNARTEVDKINRLVTLDSPAISKLHFPAAQGQDAGVLAVMKARLPGRTKTISLDRLESGVRAASPKFEGIKVKNDPPQIIVSKRPSILVTIDGKPKRIEVLDTKLLRVLNTSSLLFYDTEKEQYYLRVSDWWMEAPELSGPWTRAKKLPGDMKKVEKSIAEEAKETTKQLSKEEQAAVKQSKEQQGASLKESDKEADVPSVYVVYAPAELVEFKEEPKYSTVPGTSIQYVTNSNTVVFRWQNTHYVLVSGRWFKSSSLSGPWSYVPGTEIPAEFAKIPVDSPVASALASVPGTPQAEEGLIANSIPQTATITRSQAKLSVVYDGKPMFVPIEGTSLMYAKNTSVPVIKVAEDKYFAVEAGVWFTAAKPEGPWRVADAVPDDIYTIPASSPVHYATYAKVYGSTPEVVYVGYTPGYYGTVVSSDSTTVVYGTGWYYPPYIGPTVWYGHPYTYGVGAGFTWASSSGWSFGFGVSYYPYYPYYPWWGPMGYYGCCWAPYYGWGAWGGAAVTNVYGRWGNTAYSRTAAAWANPYTGNYGARTRGATYNPVTGRVGAGGRGYNTNIYTGNTAGYRGGAVYDPRSGIVAGGGAGFAGNRYSGDYAAGRGGFVYDTNRNAGVVGGANNVYAGKDGNVYRYDRQSGNWSMNSGNGWQSTNRPEGLSRDASSLQAQQQARTQGSQRSENFNSMRSSPSFSSRPSSMRMGGGRRR